MKEIFTSTFHAESAFISFMGKIGSWLVPLTKQIFDGAVDGPVVLYNDNQSAISSIMEGKTTERTRHIAIKFLYAHELVASNLITLATVRLTSSVLTSTPRLSSLKLKVSRRSCRTLEMLSIASMTNSSRLRGCVRTQSPRCVSRPRFLCALESSLFVSLLAERGWTSSFSCDAVRRNRVSG